MRTQIRKAVSAIKKYAEKKEEQRNNADNTMDLLSEPESFVIQFAITRIPIKKEYRFNVIELPHAIIPRDKSMCLLAKDPKEKAVTAVQENKLPFEKIIAAKSLKRKYATIADKKELANRYDYFFCESPIFEMMGKLLGSVFFEQKKTKIPHCLKDLSSETFEKALRSARFRIRGGSNVSMRIGDRSMDTEMMVDNAMAIVEYMATRYLVKHENDVHQMSIAGTNVIELPVWSVPLAEEVRVELEEAPVDAAPVAVTTTETPTSKKRKSIEKKEVSTDLTSVPVKMLKKVQSQKVDAVKQQLKPTKPATASRK
jgi:ribosomal protein L1